jgi:sialic acid synthase SpsE
MKTFVIAEAGANHNKNFNQALKLIDVAKEAGASAVKFQTYSADTLYSKNTPDFAGYKNINQLIDNIALPREWQYDLKQYSDEVGIEFMSTPFDEKAVNELYNLGVKRFKIAGFEATDLRFIRLVASTRKPLIISAGIGCSIEFIDRILSICYDEKNYNVTFLHANNAYPTPQTDANLNTMVRIAEVYNNPVGLSDHTMSTLTPALAVALGASVIEKHYTLSKLLPGPDHPFALEPNQLKEMIDNIILAEQSLGEKNGYTESEKGFINAQRAVVSKVALKAGDVLTPANVTTKRPFLEGNVPASDFYNTLNKPVNKDIPEDTAINLNDIV